MASGGCRPRPRLYSHRRVSYDSLFEKAGSKSELVATFLALLELIKSKRIRVDGEGSAQQVQMRPQAQWDTSLPEEMGEEEQQAMQAAQEEYDGD